MEPLAGRLVHDAAVYPTIRVASRPGELLMGVYDGAGAYVEGSVLDRRSGEQGAPVPRDLFGPVSDADGPEAIYAGPLYFHFGHFLLESLARAWYAHTHPEVPLVWAGQHNWGGIGLRPWQSEILDVLGIGNPTKIVTHPTRYDRLHVPDLGYRYDDTFHPEHAAFLGRYEGPRQVPGRRLWLSRSAIGSDVRDLNPEPTERRLRDAGWAVTSPETTTIRDQLDQLCRAEVVAGEEGSAFHTLILLKDVASKKFHVLRRHGKEHRNLHTIGEARGVDQSFHTIKEQLVLRAEGRVVSKISPNASAILDLLDVPVPAPPTSPAAPDDAALRSVLTDLGPRRLLEVNTRDLRLLIGSSARVRVAVSRRFDVDPRVCARSGTELYELGLLDYAQLFHPDDLRFDVIRLAGADLDEIMTSFRVSKPLAEDHTTWVLGTGDVAARAALAVQLAHPGYTAKRWFVRGQTVYIARRTPGAPVDDADVTGLSLQEVRRGVRWLRPVSPARVRRRKRRAQR